MLTVTNNINPPFPSCNICNNALNHYVDKWVGPQRPIPWYYRTSVCRLLRSPALQSEGETIRINSDNIYW